jgi:hypothetical protein
VISLFAFIGMSPSMMGSRQSAKACTELQAPAARAMAESLRR